MTSPTPSTWTRRSALVGLAGVLVAGVGVGCALTDRGEDAASDDPAPATRDPAQPYAGLEQRPIKALAPERVADLLAGRGAGYALAAELNSYPGPRHVLELRAELALTPEQQRVAEEASAGMEAEAKALGAQLVDLETELDRQFRARTVTSAELARLTTAIAAVEGQLRQVHLGAHLTTTAVLTPEQVARYDRLRGYTG
jgi:hypothetical protein